MWGTARRMSAFGVFVSIDGTHHTGLLHVSNISRDHVAYCEVHPRPRGKGGGVAPPIPILMPATLREAGMSRPSSFLPRSGNGRVSVASGRCPLVRGSKVATLVGANVQRGGGCCQHWPLRERAAG